MARLKLPYAEAVFDIDYFKKHPEPFYCLAKELYPGQFHPTVSHAFIALLARKGLLLMNFTQNIDCLERRAGVPADRIVEAHGSFATQRCIDCRAPYPDERMREHVKAEIVPKCEVDGCEGLVKPDIVFFGEALPDRFRETTHLPATADLVIVVGTSLTVYPFAGLPEYARSGTPRVLFNKERVGQIGNRSDDVVELGSCDDGIRKLASLLGWREELEELWRGVVGEKEAERQLAQAEKGHEDIEDEVAKLTKEVEGALRIDSEENETHPSQEKEASENEREGHATEMSKLVEEEDDKAAAKKVTNQVEEKEASGRRVEDDKTGSKQEDAALTPAIPKKEEVHAASVDSEEKERVEEGPTSSSKLS